MNNQAATTISLSEIQKAVALRFNISLSDLRGDRRMRSFALPRQMAMALSRELTTLSLPQIGRAFDRDHSTIIHGCRAVTRRLERHSGLREHYAALRAELASATSWKSEIKTEKDAAMVVGLFIHALGVIECG